ncbi:glycogen phosphorylase 1 [Thecamonas trahens ATCC 50062]|uniref:Alpha-1,4 glucan phosphorylase n=1 Tax=Thecamonas trahens ATCC 50062 TaxID=461836 RepID=A0A0L0DR28_THETB|nr:glycogen phosphorylase 1 [Thecamonas trahens ATCC 50062]KNC54737.1 glycogen phosphorylase 1 [Thecamonas trahens ATCC 50062]|eukprot:XP_013761637.1 glycogen phosphorylase 1 [Thecamonas trahens ATCC 50062]
MAAEQHDAEHMPPSPSGYLPPEDKADKSELLWTLLTQGMENMDRDVESIQKHIVNHCQFTLARTQFNLDSFGLYQATALSIKDHLLGMWNVTQQTFTNKDVKRVYYLSLEFLVGRALQNAVLNLDIEGEYSQALMELGTDLEKLYEEEKDAALGNGGLGRLAACFMDSLATLDYPAWGYGIRYRYGMFAQKIVDGAQVEFPDYWISYLNVWEIPRIDVSYSVRFYGEVRVVSDSPRVVEWVGGEVVQAVAYDVPIPGYGTKNCINLRLWSAKPAKEFDLQSFNQGDYLGAIEDRHKSENISQVLYPNDNTYMGKELRLKQQYFFVRATLQDILRRFLKRPREWEELPDKVAIQLNDTHPSIGIVELLRILVDEHGLEFERAWGIVVKSFHFTNHTVLPEALEKWPVELLGHLLPRHLDLIYDINYRFLQQVQAWRPGDMDVLARMSLIDEAHPRSIRMANLAIIGSTHVNGVAALHTQLLKTTIFKDFCEFFGESKFQNKTNGVTPRRWLHQANPGLAAVITSWLESDAWIANLDELAGLRAHIDNPELAADFARVKRANKVRLAELIQSTNGIEVDPDALFDIQVKRIHEYKRQLMNILAVIVRYLAIKEAVAGGASKAELAAAFVARVSIFAGKAAPGYHNAKRIIRLITAVADVVNNDPDVGSLLKVVFMPNYNVSLAEVIFPGTDLSEQISCSGMEASGTGVGKATLNGALLICTMDGASIEIAEEIGHDQVFVFGALASEVDGLRAQVQFNTPPDCAPLAKAKAAIRDGTFGNYDEFPLLLDSFSGRNDYYLINTDFESYLDAQARADAVYRDQDAWLRKAILSTAGMGFFSSDRTIRQYAEEIWGVKPCPRE